MNREYQNFFNEVFCARENQMKNDVVPSLQHMTMVKIAIELWHLQGLRKSIFKLNSDENDRPNLKKWREILNEVFIKAAHLPLPEPLKRSFMGVINIVGAEIRNWWVLNGGKIDISKVLKNFSWTQKGTINKKRTAEILVKDEELCIKLRYEIACTFCLEDKIPELWNEIPEQQKLFYHTMENLTHHNSLVRFWTNHLLSGVTNPHEIFRRRGLAFSNAINEGNVVATKFFYNKLNDGMRNFLMFEGAITTAGGRLCNKRNQDYYSEVFFYLLSKLSDDQKVQLLEEHPFEMLSCFLDFPYQPLFMNLAERVMAQQSTFDDNHIHLLKSITHKIASGWTDFEYQQLFYLLWHPIPLAHKRQAAETIFERYSIVLDLLDVGEKSIVKTLLEHKSAEDIDMMFLCRKVLRPLVLDERLELAKFVLEAGGKSKEWLMNLKLFLNEHYSKRRDEKKVESDGNKKRVESWFDLREEENNDCYQIAMRPGYKIVMRDSYESDDNECDDRESDGDKWEPFLIILDELIAKTSESEDDFERACGSRKRKLSSR